MSDKDVKKWRFLGGIRRLNPAMIALVKVVETMGLGNSLARPLGLRLHRQRQASLVLGLFARFGGSTSCDTFPYLRS